MSNYLTPSAYQAYSKLLLTMRGTVNFCKLNEEETALLDSALPPGYLKQVIQFHAAETNPVEEREQQRYMILKLCELLQKAREADVQKDNQLQRTSDMETSPGLEKVDNPAISVREMLQFINMLITAEGATHTTYAIMLKIYEAALAKGFKKENLWMLDIHIGNAYREFAARNREEVIVFLVPSKAGTPGLDF